MMGTSRGLHHTMKSGQVSASVDLLVNKYSVLISQTSGSLFKVECIMLRQWFARGGGGDGQIHGTKGFDTFVTFSLMYIAIRSCGFTRYPYLGEPLTGV